MFLLQGMEDSFAGEARFHIRVLIKGPSGHLVKPYKHPAEPRGGKGINMTDTERILSPHPLEMEE